MKTKPLLVALLLTACGGQVDASDDAGDAGDAGSSSAGARSRSGVHDARNEKQKEETPRK